MIERFTFERLQVALLFLAIAVAACLMPAQNDTWWQLSAGREMWLGHRLLVTDTFSHTVNGAFWPNHEWLSQLVLYAAYAVGGAPLTTLLCAAAVTAAWVIVWAATPAPTRVKFLLTAFVIASASTTWSPRPQVFSLLLVAATAALLHRRRYGWLPVVFCLWANLHGAVLLGVALLGAAFLASLLEDRSVESRTRLVVCSALALLATLGTPLGWRFWVEIAESLGRIRQLGIDEWAPPRLTSLAQLPFWVAIAALGIGVVVRGRAMLQAATARRDGDLTLCAFALVLAPAALTAVRNVPPFLMLAVPALAVLWFRGSGDPEGFGDPEMGRRDLTQTLVGRPFPPSREASAFAEALADRRSLGVGAQGRQIMNVAIAGVATIGAVLTVTLAYTHNAARLNWTPLPAGSLAALDRCDGNLYNRYDEGGYLIWFAPRHKVFLDGRQDPYPPSLIRAQVSAESSGDVRELFARYAIRCAYVPAGSAVADGLTRTGWTTLYRDRVWTVLAWPGERG
jgi:hypothetical protein